MVYVRVERAWTDQDGATHAAGTMVDVDASTLATLEASGIVAEAGGNGDSGTSGGSGGGGGGGGFGGEDDGGGTGGGGGFGGDDDSSPDGGGWVGPTGGDTDDGTGT